MTERKTGMMDFGFLILVSLAGAVQAMAVLTMSLFQVRHFEQGIQPDLTLYAIGILLLALLLLTLNMLFRKPLIVTFVYSFFWTLTALVNYYEIQFHGTVLTHQDIKNFSTAMAHVGNYSFRMSKAVFFIAAAFFMMAVFLIAAAVVYGKRSFRIRRITGVIPAVLMAALAWFVVFSPFAIVKKGGWSWELKYYTDSFVVGTMENINRTINPVIKPENYDVKISGISAAGLENIAADLPDIIMILNETYYDMDLLIDFETDVSYMQNYDALDAYKGYAAVPIIGGGTNASEYELLTGNAVTLLNTSTPFNDLNFNGSRNLVSYLENMGYSTIAAHPARPGNYHRSTAWRELGFDQVYFLPDFSDLEYYGDRWYGSDSSAFRNLCRYYEAMPEDRPRFAYFLTIQNHGDWDRNSSDKDLVHITNSRGLSDYDCECMNEYLTCLKQTDDCISEIVDYFSHMDRKVVVYMVGDHCPSFLSGFEEDSSAESQMKKRQVPYFIWKNYDSQNTLPQENREIDLCALTPYALQTGGLPISPYYHQLLKISEKVKCITGITSRNDNGESVTAFVLKDGSIERVDSGTPLSEMVEDYFCMEYNSLQGKPRIESLFDPE